MTVPAKIVGPKRMGNPFDTLLYETVWFCSKGHMTNVWAADVEFDSNGAVVSATCGSSWDYCEECSEGPTNEELDRMFAEIAEAERIQRSSPDGGE